MRRHGSSSQFYRSLHKLIQIRIGQSLEAVRATILLSIELIAPKVIHDLPVAIAMEDVLEPLRRDVTDMKLFVLLLEELAARCHETVS